MEYLKTTERSVLLEMVFCPGGRFKMGAEKERKS